VPFWVLHVVKLSSEVFRYAILCKMNHCSDGKKREEMAYVNCDVADKAA
jgi:hypothetical protein